MDEWTLKLIVKFFIFLGSLYQPIMAVYSTVDKYTYGGGRYIAFGIFALCVYYGSTMMWSLIKLIVSQIVVIYGWVSSMITGSDVPDNSVSDVVMEATAESAKSVAQKVAEAAPHVASPLMDGAASAVLGGAAGAATAAMKSSNNLENLPNSESADSEFEF